MYDLILRDATIVSSTGRLVADIAIRDGRIAYVGPRPRRGARQEISAIGKFIMPGVIDTAVHFGNDPAVWEEESRAAVTGGTTTVVALPCPDAPVTDRASATDCAARVRDHSWCNYGLWMQADAASADEVSGALAAGEVLGALIDVADGTEDAATGQLTSLLDIEGLLAVRIRRDNRDAGGVAPVLDLARKSDRNLHIVHLSTAEEISALDPLHGEIPVTATVTPHHLFLSSEADDEGQAAPPLRPEQDRRTLWAALKRGRFVGVASDHHRAPTEGPGIPGAELMFPLMLSAVRHGKLSLEQLVAITSEGPAKMLGLESKGRIEKGADADLVLFSEGDVARIRERDLVSGAGWSPYLGREAAPKPDLVIVNGKIVSTYGTIAPDTPNGQQVNPRVAVASK